MKVHINQLPVKRNYVFLNENYYDSLFNKIFETCFSIANASRLLDISKSALGRFSRKENKRIRIDFLLKISDFLNIPLEEIENKIVWIGNNQSHGIINPNLPFNFNSRAGARFLAAICNEGWISDGAYYSNSSKELRYSVKNDALSVFGGDNDTIREWIKEKDQYLAFPSIIRDVLILITKFKGVKSVNNPPVPSFILENKKLIFGWIEQTIADEGHVKYYDDKYRREIIWRRSFNKNLNECKLNTDERKMLDKIGISYDVKNIGTYKTKKGIEKIRLQIRLSKRKNLLKLRKQILIPCNRKNKTLTKMMRGFVRYKEPLKVKDAINQLCKDRGFVTSIMLKREMNYKNTTTACVWLKKYLNKGFIKIMEPGYYHSRGRRIAAKYTLRDQKAF
ncbi:MAG: helix-turn-helix transcriptional regulator [Nanoarchaeota archaeon]|nr:helix-turn-helix transcriptional regulator [Nanoarchaeota archaeon]MBU1321947.1 helix-turn-helix transcriptional regulator [Nanoarchaeota archaeon]MBU1597943.1 helix-turn-helix transcriptional regulator [Nanoarchaeota archaeon]MBU2441180.1 helix-turn-helix transcriptional regulator [Nanoarchaeota archaeon]